MNKMQQQVREFHEAFQVAVPSKPCVPDLETRKLRAKLILEEAFETIEAMGLETYMVIGQVGPISFKLKEAIDVLPNLNETADGIADLLYVTLGTAIAHGIDIEPIFDEVHRSNMSKLHTKEEVCGLSGGFTAEVPKVYENVCDRPQRCYIVKDASGKVIKSPSYSKADIASVLAKQF